MIRPDHCWVLFFVFLAVSLWASAQPEEEPWVIQTNDCATVNFVFDDDENTDDDDTWDGRLLAPANVIMSCVGPRNDHRFAIGNPEFSGRAYFQACNNVSTDPPTCANEGLTNDACRCTNRDSDWVDTFDDSLVADNICGGFGFQLERTWYVDCYNDNSRDLEIVQTIWYIDDALPEVQFPDDYDVECTDDLTVASLPRPYVYDACGEPFTIDGPTVAAPVPVANCAGNARHTITVSYDVVGADGCGFYYPATTLAQRTQSGSYTITVRDFQPPEVTTAAVLESGGNDLSLFVACPNEISDATIQGFFDFTDACNTGLDITPSVTRRRVDPPHPICRWDYQEHVEVSGADDCGNVAVVDLTLQYGDVEPPTFQIGGGAIQSENYEERLPCRSQFTDPVITAADACMDPNPTPLTTISEWTSASDHLREWQRTIDSVAIDECGNKSTLKIKQIATNNQNDLSLTCCRTAALQYTCDLGFNGCAGVNAQLIISAWPLAVNTINNDDLNCDGASAVNFLRTEPGEVYTCTTSAADNNIVITLSNPGTLPSNIATTDLTIRAACVDCEDDNLSNNVFKTEVQL